MIDKLVSGAIRALGGAIKVVLLFGVLVGLVVWARTNPESWKAAMSQRRRARRLVRDLGCRAPAVLAGPGRQPLSRPAAGSCGGRPC